MKTTLTKSAVLVEVNLFGKKKTIPPKIQSVKYAGSKLKIIPYICDLIKDLEIKTVLDGFFGTTRV